MKIHSQSKRRDERKTNKYKKSLTISIGESALFLEKDRVVYLIVHCNGFMLIELDVCRGSSL